MDEPVLTTTRLVLRDFVAEDLADLQAVRSDPEVAQFMDFAPETVEQSRAWLDWALAHARRRPRDGFNLAAVDRVTGHAIGWVGFGESSRYPAGTGEVGVGYMLGRADWGQGYATEAVRAVFGHCFGSMGSRRVSAWCWAENGASARVMEKVGMRLQGRVERTDPKSGAERASLEYAVRVEEWGGDDEAQESAG
jgi:ribosomal-protein-alanine N-acetyltransferase